MFISACVVTASCVLAIVAAQRGVISPLVSACGYNLPPSVVCINKYAAVMPYPFERPVFRSGPVDPGDNFQSTNVPKDPSFALTKNASFLVFDKARGLKILGRKPTYKFMFTLKNFIHEAPVYLPAQNKLIFSELAYGSVALFSIDLSASPPTLSTFNPDPPVYGVNGGTLYKGLVYLLVEGSKPFGNGTLQEPGIVVLDPATNKVRTLLNNYYGTYFNSPNDITIDAKGDIFFTDALYGWQQNLTARAPALETAAYRFRPSTGSVNIVENGLIEPNGIGLSPDEKTMYITDSGAGYSTIYLPPNVPLPPLAYNATNPRTVFAYDVRNSPGGKFLVNKRPIYLTQTYLPDGFHVARNGYLLVAAGVGYVLIFFINRCNKLCFFFSLLSWFFFFGFVQTLCVPKKSAKQSRDDKKTVSMCSTRMVPSSSASRPIFPSAISNSQVPNTNSCGCSVWAA